MRKFFVIAILGLAGLGFSVEQASAGKLCNWCCCKKCCVKLCAKQYNAFSPFCLDSIQGCVQVTANPGCGPWGCGQGCGCGYQGCGPTGCFPHGYGMPGELPPPGPMGPGGPM